MAITTYSELKTAVADWLNRSDLTSAIPNFIALAEAKMNRTLRTRKMQTSATLTLSSNYVNLPADWLENIRVQLNTNPVTPLVYETPEQIIEDSQVYSANGQPLFFSVIGSQLQVLPYPDTSYDISVLYYAKIPALSDSNTTNWLLTEAPDLYLYATLIQSAPYLKEDERIGTWTTLYDQVAAELRIADDNARVGNSKLMPRIRSFG